MGAGNFRFRNTEFAQTNLMIDQSNGDYEGAREDALNKLRDALSTREALVEAGLEGLNPSEMSLDELVEAVGVDDAHELCGADYSVLDGQETSFYNESAGERWDGLNEGLSYRLGGLQGIQVYEQRHRPAAECVGMGRGDFDVVAKGRFVEVGIKHWEHYYHVGVHPIYAVDNYEESIASSNQPVPLEWQKRIANLVLQLGTTDASPEDLEEYKAFVGEGAHQFPASTLERIKSLYPYGRESVGGVADTLIREAYKSIENGEEQAFAEDFGVEAGDVIADEEMIASIGEVASKGYQSGGIGVLPALVDKLYNAEFARIELAVKRAVFDVTNDVSEPNGAWTSKRVEPPEPEPVIEPDQQVQAALSTPTP